MTLRGYNQGFGNGAAAGFSAARATSNDADSAIAEWKRHSNQLKAKLAEAEKQAVYSSAREAGRDAQQKALRAALKALDPNHPLLKVLPNIGGEAMVKAFEARGYDYDRSTETVRKKL